MSKRPLRPCNQIGCTELTRCGYCEKHSRRPSADTRLSSNDRGYTYRWRKGDAAARGAWYKTMREISVYSPNDICELEDLPSVPGGETRYASLNYVPLELFSQLSISRSEGGNS